MADSIRRIHGGPAIPGLFVPLRVAEAYLALAASRGVPRPAGWDDGPRRGPPHRAGPARRADRAAPVPQRPAERNFIDDGERIRIVDWEYAGMGDPFFDLGNFSVNHELTPEEDAALLSAYDQSDAPDPARLARLTLMRVVSDFREAMWGVLQQGISTLDVDFVAYADEHFERLARHAAEPRFEEALPRSPVADGTVTARVRHHRRRGRRGGGRLPPGPPGLDRCRPARAVGADQRVDLPLGRAGGPAAGQPDPDPDDGRQRRDLSAAGRRDRRRPGLARGRLAAPRLLDERMEELHRQAGWAKAYGLADGAVSRRGGAATCSR